MKLKFLCKNGLKTLDQIDFNKLNTKEELINMAKSLALIPYPYKKITQKILTTNIIFSGNHPIFIADYIFYLQDTEGFPYDIAIDMFREKGYEVDIERYEAIAEWKKIKDSFKNNQYEYKPDLDKFRNWEIKLRMYITTMLEKIQETNVEN